MPDSGGSLRSIKNARLKRRAFEQKVHDSTEELKCYLTSLEAKIDSFAQTLKELVNANNSASLLLASIERWLDSNHVGWDDGIRGTVAERGELIKRRAFLIDRARSPRDGTEVSREERGEIATELWGIAPKLGTEVNDWPICVGLLLQARRIKEARERFDELKTVAERMPPELRTFFGEVEARLTELEREDRRIWTPELIK